MVMPINGVTFHRAQPVMSVSMPGDMNTLVTASAMA